MIQRDLCLERSIHRYLDESYRRLSLFYLLSLIPAEYSVNVENSLGKIGRPSLFYHVLEHLEYCHPNPGQQLLKLENGE